MVAHCSLKGIQLYCLSLITDRDDDPSNEYHQGNFQALLAVRIEMHVIFLKQFRTR